MKIARPSDKNIHDLLTNAATMYEIAENQRRTAVSVGYANGWTYERIAAVIGRSYPATRALALKAADAA